MIDIRIAKKEHISALGEIERSAAGMFSELDLPARLRNETVSPREKSGAFPYTDTLIRPRTETVSYFVDTAFVSKMNVIRFLTFIGLSETVPFIS